MEIVPDFVTKADALVQPYSPVKYSTLLVFFVLERSKLVTTVFAGGCFSTTSWKVSTIAIVFSGCDSRLAGGLAVIQAWPLPPHTHTLSPVSAGWPAAVDRVQLR